MTKGDGMMRNLSRRDFMKLAGAGTAALAGVGAAVTALTSRVWPTALRASRAGSALRFRATTGLPQRPLPSYASLVWEGTVDPISGSGVLRRSVLAGAPEAMSAIELPGTARALRVTSVVDEGDSLLIRAMAEDPSVLGAGESPRTSIRIDQGRGLIWAPFVERQLELRLVA